VADDVYLALGDSMTIDLYPERDALERWGKRETGLGAGSLLFRNVAALWPEFEGRDLATRRHGLEFVDLSEDGALIESVLVQLQRENRRTEVAIATITAGGNDLLGALSLPSFVGLAALAMEARAIQDAYARMVEKARAALPRARLVLTTIYDPTDGTGRLWASEGRLPIEFLKQTNDRIREVAAATRDAVLADVHLHFMGHGMTAPADERWYWPPNPIEPSARGASEIRRVWLEALGI
jgi:lysophospholipase L1-like esterase